MPRSFLARLATALAAAALLLPLGAAAVSAAPIEDYADYQPQTRCSPGAKPGTAFLGRWVVRRYGGGLGPISRRCGGSRSEHAEGRAFDWQVSARRPADRQRVGRFLERLLRTDVHGNPHAWARRMGVMYVIWNDRMWSAWDRFRPERYLSSSCPTVRRCSETLRHRDHVHVSLTRAGGRGGTSWFEGRLPAGR